MHDILESVSQLAGRACTRWGTFAGVFLAAALTMEARGAELSSEVRPLQGAGGVPALYVNGKVTSQVLAAPYRNPAQSMADFTDFHNAGIDMYDIYLRFPWTAAETYDFGPVDQRMDAILAANPAALVMPRVLLTPGRWFGEQYPEEISRRDDGSAAGMFPGQNAGNNPSFSSTVYRELSRKAMAAFLAHVEGKYGEHVVGYQVGNGFGGEWLPFNSFWEQNPPPTKFGVEDYSPAAVKGFRGFLRGKYRTDAGLQAAWHDARVTLETASIPNEKERYTTTDGIFFDPAVSCRVPDWFMYYNDSVASVLVENAAWVKELTGRKKIVGSFYGYLWCNFPNLSAVHSGQLGLTKVLASPDVDFLCSPYTYDNKELGGPNNSQSLPNACALHGKLYFNEVDTETHVTGRQWRWGNSLNLPRNFAETRALLVRDYAYSLTNGNGLWWTDLRGGDYHDQQVVGLLKQLQEIDNKYVGSRPGSNAEICCVLDESAFTYTGDGEPLWNALLTAQKQWEFGFIGAPWDCQLLSDIANPKLPDYNFYIFLNTFHVTAAQRDAIHAKLKKNHATALWVYAPGYIGETGNSVENMTALTGIKFGKEMTAGELHVTLGMPFNADVGSAALVNQVNGVAFGTDVRVADITRYYDHQLYLKDPRDPALVRDLPGFRIAPRFFVDEPAHITLGTLAGVNKLGVIAKEQEGWTSMYSAAPLVPAALLRNMARAAGCAIYSDGDDNVYANENFLGIYSPKGGDRTIKLPKKSRVVDLLTGKVVGDGIGEFAVKLQVNETVLYRMEGGGGALGPPADGRTFLSFRAAVEHEPDADVAGAFWKGIPGVVMDKSVMGPEMPAFRAEVRSRWTEKNIYFLFAGHYEKLTVNAAPETKKETPRLWEKDVFELYIGADFEHMNLYRELQMSPAGEFLDNNIDSTVNRPGFNGEEAWNSGFVVRARIDEKNKVWYGEMQIPLAAIDTRPAKVGNEMRVNLFRQDTPLQPIPPSAADTRPRPRAFLAWQPPGVWNPHHPEKFGTLRLVEGP